MSSPNRVGDLQLVILEVLWDSGEASAAVVHKALLPTHGLAPTTIATMLRKMEKRGLVAFRRDGRQLIHRALVQREEITRSMVDDLVSRLFAGDPASLVHHLLREGELDSTQIDALRKRVSRRKKEARDD